MLRSLHDSILYDAQRKFLCYFAMHISPYIFTTLKWFGIWRPVEWSSRWKTNIYWIYTFVVMLLLSFSPISEIVYLVKFVKDVDEMTSSSFLLLTETCIFFKATNILNSRRDIIRSASSLIDEISKPNGPEEIKIQKEFDRQIRLHTMIFATLVSVTISLMYVGNYLNNVPQRTLSYNACFPFDHSTNIGYLVAYLYQVIAQGIYGVLCVAYDFLFCGLMGQACAQLRILQYRLTSMPQTIRCSIESAGKLNYQITVEEVENRVLRKCIRHHQNIFKYAKLTNDMFGLVILLQCSISTFVMCCNIYLLSQMKLFSPEFASTSAYMASALTQIFMYCWYGNEVILASMDVTDAVYKMDWTILNVRTQKKLLTLMVRTWRPIKITSAGIIVLSLDTYKRLLKLSYSIYNFLQQSSQK